MIKNKAIVIGAIIALAILGYVLIYVTVNIKADEQDFKAFEVVTGLFTLLLTLGAVLYAYRAFQQQKKQNECNEKQLEISRYELQYSRALDLIYKQMEIVSKKISGFQGSLNRLDNYKDISDLPLFINDLKPTISNFSSMSYIVEQFLSRTTLHPNDKSYLYLLFSENLPPDFIVIPHRYARHIDTLGDTIEEVKKNALLLYIEKEKKKIINSNPECEHNSDKWFEVTIANRDENTIKDYLENIQILANISYGALDARKRLLNPQHKSKIFSFLKNDDSEGSVTQTVSLDN
ncbi:hypothetical protein ACR780_10650 [Sphingobacterium faecium]|uniref:hypothetical protein n=1 Tax=Sphingobacterium faecium TaxID=34087 RepID=UPI003DA4F11E